MTAGGQSVEPGVNLALTLVHGLPLMKTGMLGGVPSSMARRHSAFGLGNGGRGLNFKERMPKPSLAAPGPLLARLSGNPACDAVRPGKFFTSRHILHKR